MSDLSLFLAMSTQAWLSCNRLTLKEDKPKYVTFHRKQRGHPSSTRKYVLGNKLVSRVANVKFLGLITLACKKKIPGNKFLIFS